jgi:hypothetical protein
VLDPLLPEVLLPPAPLLVLDPPLPDELLLPAPLLLDPLLLEDFPLPELLLPLVPDPPEDPPEELDPELDPAPESPPGVTVSDELDPQATAKLGMTSVRAIRDRMRMVVSPRMAGG